MPEHNLFDLGAFQELGLVPRDKDYIPAAAAQGRYSAVSRLDNSAAAVALNGTAELFSGCYPNTANSRAVFQYIGNQRRICLCSASPVGSAKITVLLKRYYFRQSNQSVRFRVLKT